MRISVTPSASRPHVSSSEKNIITKGCDIKLPLHKIWASRCIRVSTLRLVYCSLFLSTLFMSSLNSSDRFPAHIDTKGWNPQQVTTPPQYLGRKTLPIKRADAEPLTREDIQYDLLFYIFANPVRAFVDYMAPGRPLVNFCDLYVNALFNSSKCSKVLKDKMVETPTFAIEFAKIALLTNVGRINTTMAFFPEMKTALRSYHPVPSLQKSDGNLQDAPRIKNCLKAALLPFEFKTPPPATPEEIREKARSGQIPPTSVVNLIFVLSNSTHALRLAEAHFEPPVEANAFLWIIFHYLSPPDTPNPFDDENSRAHPGKAPKLVTISREEMLRENQDPQEEIEWGRRMSQMRSKFLKELVDEMEAEKRRKKNPVPVTTSSSNFSNPLSNQELAALRRSTRAPASGHLSRASSYSHDYATHQIPVQQPAPRPPPVIQTQASSEGDSNVPERSMLEHAWHIIRTRDPLDDSDTEIDDHMRRDYSQRLRILSRLRGKDPTPPPMDPSAGPFLGPNSAISGPAYQQPYAHLQGSQSMPPFYGPSTGKLREVNWSSENY
ncbi:hypothetical protein NM688_g4740 [Phlebia brevispora]|uniref:Uncharacterized protein n=1 Tax=Phlebia brevispora TaxID=194682 RepID=A0ACC1T1S6_9APHY|nr:hypothetical protein NM688_g4740 [Phlebia brevispora]